MRDHAIQNCLTESDLRRYHARELDDAELRAFEEHIEHCDLCAANAKRLLSEHDTWIDQLRRAGAPPKTQTRFVPSNSEQLESGDIEGYEIRGEISRGGQGVVYNAVQKSTGREVAVKVLREGADASPAARRRFEREIELAAALRHPNIVTVFDSGRTRDGGRFYVMDFVRGRSLSRHLREATPSLTDALETFARICEAVNAAHQRGVIHRDLKPSNILVNDAGEPFVLDFGLARQIVDEGGTLMTAAGQVTGTLPYMSPEQVRGDSAAVDVRSDVYTLGVILYELLTDEYPYPVETGTIQTLRHIAETSPTPPEQFVDRQGGGTRRRLDADLRTIVLKALSKEPDRRYQTAGNLARDVRHQLAGEPIEARRDSHVYVLRKILRRYRVAATFAAAFVALLAISAVTLGVMYANQRQLRADAEQQAEAARAAEALATQRFEDVRKLANFFVMEFDGLIKRLPGAAPAREALTRKGLEYLDLLARDAADDPQLQQELASAYITIGDIQGEKQSSNLGDLRGAMQSYEKAREILEKLIAADPDSDKREHALVLTLVKIADAHSNLGDRDDAMSTYRDVAARGEAWEAAHPEDHAILRAYGAAHQRLGRYSLEQGGLDEALAHFEESWRLAQRIPDDVIGDFHRVHGRITELMNIGQIHYAQGRLEEGLESYRAALPIAEDFKAAHPDDVVARRTPSITRQWIGIILADLGRHEQAVQSYNASIAIQEALARDVSDDGAILNDLATTLSKLGESQMALGDQDAALISYRRSTDAIKRLTRRRPDYAPAQRMLGVAHYKLAEFHRTLASDESRDGESRLASAREARDRLKRSLDVFLHMREIDILIPSDVGVPDELAGELQQLDSTIERLAQPSSETVDTP